MHELAIAEQIVQVVMTHIEAHEIEHVTNVRIQVGEATGVVADSLSFSFEMIASTETELVGAKLLIDSVPYRAKCRHCHKEFHVKHFIVQCPTCETWDADIVSGKEFKVLDMETA